METVAGRLTSVSKRPSGIAISPRNDHEPFSPMTAFVFVAIVLCVMASVDWYFSNRLMADIQGIKRHAAHFAPTLPMHPVDPNVSTMMIPTAVTETPPPEADAEDIQREVDMVAEALNSRYMQWGAVGVMLGLFVWLVTRWAPAQERRRDEERKQQTDAFLKSLEKRDERFTEELRVIRTSVDAHVRDVTSATEKLADRLADEFSELRDALHKR